VAASKSITVYFTGKLVSRFSTHRQSCKPYDKPYWRNVGS